MLDKERIKYLEEKYSIQMWGSRLHEICDWFEPIERYKINTESMKTKEELEKECSDVINDKNLQDICEWKSPIDTMEDEIPFTEEDYMKRAVDNLEYLKRNFSTIKIKKGD